VRARAPKDGDSRPPAAVLAAAEALNTWHDGCTEWRFKRRVRSAHLTMENNVIDKVGFLVRFWELKARHATLGHPLSSPEQVELLSLMQLVTGDFRVPEPGPCARPADAFPAQLIGEGILLSVEVRHVCAGALLVASVKPMSLGERALVRTSDAITGVEYTLPCNVAWVHHGNPCIMGLCVDGVPTCGELETLPGPRPVHLFSMGRQARLVG
jgi:hypothetical protein